MPDGSFRSTVDSWNRERDQRRIEKKLGIPEEGVMCDRMRAL